MRTGPVPTIVELPSLRLVEGESASAGPSMKPRGNTRTWAAWGMMPAGKVSSTSLPEPMKLAVQSVRTRADWLGSQLPAVTPAVIVGAAGQRAVALAGRSKLIATIGATA